VSSGAGLCQCMCRRRRSRTNVVVVVVVVVVAVAACGGHIFFHCLYETGTHENLQNILHQTAAAACCCCTCCTLGGGVTAQGMTMTTSMAMQL
jgi:ABC-type enterochelin transport system permease subunit